MLAFRVSVAQSPLPRGVRREKVEKAAGLLDSRLMRKLASRLVRWLLPPLGLVRSPMLVRALGPGWFLGGPGANR